MANWTYKWRCHNNEEGTSTLEANSLLEALAVINGWNSESTNKTYWLVL